MKAYPLIVGRGKYAGYAFTATAPNAPFSATWIGGHRASDTLEHRPILEMQCVKYGQPVLISSQWVVEGRPFGYTEYLELKLPDSSGELERYLEAPGRMLYLDFMDAATFLSLDRENGSGHETLDVMEVTLPEPDSCEPPELPEDMLAALLADVWYNSFRKLLGNSYTPLRLELAMQMQGAATLDTGRAFLNKALLPLLPPSVRHTVSVSIGSFYDSGIKLSGSAALIISLPDGRDFSMKGGYHPGAGSYQMLGDTQWRDLGQALKNDREGHLSYYWKLHSAKPYTLLAADFEVAWLLFHAHRLIHAQPLTARELSEALKDWQRLDQVIGQSYPGIDARERRMLLAPLETDLIGAWARLEEKSLVQPGTYEMPARKAFSLVQEAAGDSTELKNDYTQVLALPAGGEKSGSFPLYGLWTDLALLRSLGGSDPELFLDCTAAGLGEPSYGQPFWAEPVSALLKLYADPAGTAWKQRLGALLSGYVAGWLGKQGDAESIYPMREAIRSAPQREELNALLTGAFNRAARDQQEEKILPLSRFLQACGYFGWPVSGETRETVLLLLKARGQRGVCTLEEIEQKTLTDMLQTDDKRLKNSVFAALNPMARIAREGAVTDALTGFLPLLWADAPGDMPEGGWLIAWRRNLENTLSGVFQEASRKNSVLLAPEEAWERICPFRRLKIRSLDELSWLYLSKEELTDRSRAPLQGLLRAYDLTALLAGIQPLPLSGGWFGSLLKECMGSLLRSGRMEELLKECSVYDEMAALERLCNAFLGQEELAGPRGALSFVTHRPAAGARAILAAFRELPRRDLACMLLEPLLHERVHSAMSPWDPGRWEDRVLMACLGTFEMDGRTDARAADFLLALGVDLGRLDDLDPWDALDGGKAFGTILYAFRWLKETGLDAYTDGLAAELQAHRRFTGRACRGRKARAALAPLFRDRDHAGDEVFPPALRQWLSV